MCSTQATATRALLMAAAMLASVAADGSASGSDRGIDVVSSSSKEQAASLTLLITGAVGLALCVVFSIMFYSLGVVMRLVDPEGYERRQEQRRRRSVPRPMRTGPPLVLEGWKALQQKLIRNELSGMEQPSLPPDDHSAEARDHQSMV